MDFHEKIDEIEKGQAYNPFAGKNKGEWKEGTISIDFLNEHFGQYETADEMINATDSEGLKKYFQFLKNKGKLN